MEFIQPRVFVVGRVTVDRFAYCAHGYLNGNGYERGNA
jgi:hypothetical protein